MNLLPNNHFGRQYFFEKNEKSVFFCTFACSKYITMKATVLNDAQLELLKMMSFFSSPEALGDLKQAISNYFAKKAEDEIDRLWENGTLTEEKVEGFRSLHERTPYPAQ